MLLPFYLKIQLVNYHCSCLSPQWRIQRGSLLRSPVPCHSREHVNYNRLEGEVPKQDFRWPAEYRSSGIILCWPEISAAQGSCGAWGPPVCKQGLSLLLEDIWTQQLLLGKWEESDAEDHCQLRSVKTSAGLCTRTITHTHAHDVHSSNTKPGISALETWLGTSMNWPEGSSIAKASEAPRLEGG